MCCVVNVLKGTFRLGRLDVQPLNLHRFQVSYQGQSAMACPLDVSPCSRMRVLRVVAVDDVASCNQRNGCSYTFPPSPALAKVDACSAAYCMTSIEMIPRTTSMNNRDKKTVPVDEQVVYTYIWQLLFEEPAQQEVLALWWGSRLSVRRG